METRINSLRLSGYNQIYEILRGGGNFGNSLFIYTGLKGTTGTHIGARSPAALSRKKQS